MGPAYIYLEIFCNLFKLFWNGYKNMQEMIWDFSNIFHSIYFPKCIKKNNIKSSIEISNIFSWASFFGDRYIPPRKIPPGRFHPGCFPPEHSPPTKLGFAKYAADANLFLLESSILTRAKRATNRNNAATNRKNISFFRGRSFLGGIYRSGTFRGEYT